MKDKELVKKTIKQKNSENIFNSYQNSVVEVSNLKDLRFGKPEDDNEIKRVYKKIDEVLNKVKEGEINCFI